MDAIHGSALFQQGALALDEEYGPAVSSLVERVAAALANTAPVKRPRRSAGADYDFGQFRLQLPLLFVGVVPDASDDISSTKEAVPLTVEAFEPVPSAEVSRNRSTTDGESPPFKDDLRTYCAAHAGVLYRSLEILLWATSATSVSRQEVVEWIFTEMVDYTDSRDGKTFRVPARDFPFSFENCCIAEDINPEYARDRIWALLERIRNGETVQKAALH